MKLHTYFRSSAAFRVRIALELKQVAWEPVYVGMLEGEHREAAYNTVNPMHLVPALETEAGTIIQSAAICEYLEEAYPEPALLPADPVGRAYVRAIMNAVACEIHPLNNLRVLHHLTGPLGHSGADKLAWYQHWIAEGFAGLEAFIARSGRSGDYACGDAATMADAFIVPQVYNARRFDCPMGAYPNLVRIDAHCRTQDAFIAASPERQGDART